MLGLDSLAELSARLAVVMNSCRNCVKRVLLLQCLEVFLGLLLRKNDHTLELNLPPVLTSLYDAKYTMYRVMTT